MVKVGIIGTGNMAKTHADAYKKISGVEIAGFVGNSETQGRQVALNYDSEYFVSLAALLDRKDIQVVDICVPTDLHESYVIQSAEAGRHILCEKPLSLELDSVDRMIAAVSKAGVKFMVAQVLRFWPEYVAIKEMYDNGSLGQLNVISASRMAQHPNWGDWFKDVSRSGGGLFDLHWHDIDFMSYLLGPVESVYAVGRKYDNGAWDHVVSNLTFCNGTKASIEGCFRMPDGYPFSASFRGIGDETGIDYKFSAGFNLEDLESSSSSLTVFKKGQEPTRIVPEQNDPFHKELQYFIDCVVNDQEPKVVTPAESREVLRIILAIKQSLETGEIIKL
jgi:predicted dehydrogenase